MSQNKQMLVAWIAAITPPDRLAVRLAAPLSPRGPQTPCDFGLFDVGARNQLNLI